MTSLKVMILLPLTSKMSGGRLTSLVDLTKLKVLLERSKKTLFLVVMLEARSGFFEGL